MKKTCEWCGKEFEIESWRGNRFCGKSCASTWSMSRPEIKAKCYAEQRKTYKKPIEKKCEWCGATFKLKVRTSTKRFCGTSCSAKWRLTVPEIRAKLYSAESRKAISSSLKKFNKENPWVAAASSKRMKENNPSSNPETMKKIKEHWKQYGHPLQKQQLRGGNGRPLPRPQRILAAALGCEWKVEHAIPTKEKSGSGFPSCYKVDLALPSKRVWIELDGWSHSLPEQQERDEKKTALLTKLGWRGLRIQNNDVEIKLRRTLSTISKFLGTPLSTPTEP